MGLMDKVKVKAQEAAAEAKKAADRGKVKVDQMQLGRKRDDAAKKLGYLVHAERTTGIPGGAEADRLIAEISSLGSQIDELDASGDAAAATPPPPPEASSEPPGGVPKP